jgi:hypothetical protein
MTTNIVSHPAIQDSIDRAQAERMDQYTLWQILGIWALAALPMGILAWVVFPAVSPDFNTNPLGAGATLMALMTVGLIWQFVLSMIIVRKEEGDLRWATIKRRLRLNAPQDPTTGKTRRRLWLWVIPFLIASVVYDLALTPSINKLWVSIFPFLTEPSVLTPIFQSQEIFKWLVGLVPYCLQGCLQLDRRGFLFRGVLLPKMEGVFGRWSWLANGVLFGLYHVHIPWVILQNVISGPLVLAFPSWRFRSTGMAISVHAAQSVYAVVLILVLVLGLA